MSRQSSFAVTNFTRLAKKVRKGNAIKTFMQHFLILFFFYEGDLVGRTTLELVNKSDLGRVFFV